MERHGVYLPRQSMARWVGLAADWLRPIYEQIRTGVMGGGYVQVDETPLNIWNPVMGGRGRVTWDLQPARWRRGLRLADQPRRHVPG